MENKDSKEAYKFKQKFLHKLLKQKLDGMVEVNYPKQDVIQSWNNLSLTQKKRSLYFTNQSLISKIYLINNTLLSMDVFQKTVSYDASFSTLNPKNISKTKSEDKCEKLPIVSGLEIIWNLGKHVKTNSESITNSDFLEEDVIEFGLHIDPDVNLLKLKDSYLEPVDKVAEYLEGSDPEFLIKNQFLMKEEQLHLLFPSREINSWQKFEICLVIMIQNSFLQNHLKSLLSQYQVSKNNDIHFEQSKSPSKKKPRKKRKKNKSKKNNSNNNISHRAHKQKDNSNEAKPVPPKKDDYSLFLGQIKCIQKYLRGYNVRKKICFSNKKTIFECNLSSESDTQPSFKNISDFDFKMFYDDNLIVDFSEFETDQDSQCSEDIYFYQNFSDIFLDETEDVQPSLYTTAKIRKDDKYLEKFDEEEVEIEKIIQQDYQEAEIILSNHKWQILTQNGYFPYNDISSFFPVVHYFNQSKMRQEQMTIYKNCISAGFRPQIIQPFECYQNQYFPSFFWNPALSYEQADEYSEYYEEEQLEEKKL